MNQRFRYERTWQLIGWLGIFLSIAFPLLMFWNKERFDAAVVIEFFTLALAGAWGVLYFKRYALSISDEGFTIDRLFRQSIRIAWDDVIAVRCPRASHKVDFETSDRRRIKISINLPGLGPLLATAHQKLPETVWTRPDDAPGLEFH